MDRQFSLVSYAQFLSPDSFNVHPKFKFQLKSKSKFEEQVAKGRCRDTEHACEQVQEEHVDTIAVLPSKERMSR